jgi:acyl-CoA synthetase (AMP-forming)/AMP-acid ligase II
MMSIRRRLAEEVSHSGLFLWGAAASVSIDDLRRRMSFGGCLTELAGRSVLIATKDQLAAAVALIELDGIARRLVICTPDIAPPHLESVIARAGVDAIVSDNAAASAGAAGGVCGGTDLCALVRVSCSLALSPAHGVPPEHSGTEWVLLTSGTTGAPKLVAHTLASLTAPFGKTAAQATDLVWGTFYDIRRYGGLQIFLRAVLGQGSLVLAGPGEPLDSLLSRLGRRGVTHVSGTPSHWRRALMSSFARAIAPRYIRLSGEIVDQGILRMLRSFYPNAAIGHAFASTEAGVGFEVDDGLEGFPSAFVGARGGVDLKIQDGSLCIRSNRIASGYVGDEEGAIAGEDGFVDTGDLVQLRRDRYHFLGRRNGTINVGGLKVHPEEVERVINRHPSVRMSVVQSRRNPIMGSLVIADVVLTEDAAEAADAARDFQDAAQELAGNGTAALKREILQVCRDNLAAHKVPAAIRFVPAVELSAAGKLARQPGLH